MQTTRDLTAIGETVHTYFEGMHLGDTARLRQAFHPQAFLFGYFNDAFCHDSLDAWMREVESTPKPAENGEPFDMRIVATDVTGRVATVKVAALYLGLRFTDYLTLAQFGERWQIVNKAYHHD
ncbi:nuclear transport factor 2 family protein [Pseudomonas cavernae]|uniref:Nuclear transport factor 2 family protein n=1 Tax=Pseudomonas cavernae TaxID=2320867 RepID=A0A385Z1L1_9PSED|nr:nuclear transport factor 2 family protein [Pseudomonas cavernae]AYC31532.1 nuclear transport factor 2 family protein [Pseudomonas cavernae]